MHHRLMVGAIVPATQVVPKGTGGDCPIPTRQAVCGWGRALLGRGTCAIWAFQASEGDAGSSGRVRRCRDGPRFSHMEPCLMSPDYADHFGSMMIWSFRSSARELEVWQPQACHDPASPRGKEEGYPAGNS